MFQNKKIQIPADLTSYVKDIWAVDRSDSGREDAPLSIYADGCPGIIFQQNAAGLFLEGSNKRLSSILVYGQTIEPIKMAADGALQMVVINFHPHAAHPLFRFNASEITNDCYDLDILPAVPRINLTEKLWNAVSIDDQVVLLLDYIRKLIGRNKSEIDQGMQLATSRILSMNGNLSLKALREELRLTERTFERRFNRHIGVSPQLFAKISRFQAAVSQMRYGRFTKLTDVAYSAGYADQSHFIRNFKKFTRLSPLEYLRTATTTIEHQATLLT